MKIQAWSMILLVGSTSLVLFQNCGKMNSQAQTPGDSPTNLTSGFPSWSVPPEFLMAMTIKEEAPANLPSALTSAAVLIETSGASVEKFERYDLSTIKITEVGSTGGFIQLSLLPDGRYRLFVFIKSSQYGLAYGQVTREYGRYRMAASQLFLKPETSETQTGSSSGAVSTKMNQTAERVYGVYSARFETLLSSGAENEGYILRGPCPPFSVPATCISGTTAEHRLQPALVK